MLMHSTSSFPDEDPRTPYLDDALHWMTVYEELLAFAHSLRGGTPAEAGAERNGSAAAATCASQVDMMLRRFDERYVLWRQRAHELASRRRPLCDGAGPHEPFPQGAPSLNRRLPWARTIR